MNIVITSLIIAGVALFIVLWSRRLAGRAAPPLRPLTAYAALKGQVGRAIESASQLHVSLGRASLTGPASPTSIAALSVLSKLAQDGCRSDTPPLTTVGDATLLPLAENKLRHAADISGSQVGIPSGTARFIAAKDDSFAYAAGVAAVIQQEKVLGNVMVGHFGQEIAIVTEAAGRHQVHQVFGSDDPLALAVAMAATENVMIGEELLAAPAYVEGKPDQLAALQLQDMLRLAVSLILVGLAVWQLAGG